MGIGPITNPLLFISFNNFKDFNFLNIKKIIIIIQIPSKNDFPNPSVS